jgi:hypothetical protein
VVKSGDSLNYNTSDNTGANTTEPGVTETDNIGVNDAEASDVIAKGDNKTEVGITTEKRQDDVEVPELGQETGKKPNVALAIAAITGVGVVLVAAWWFLFIGKRKANEGKEKKE